MKCGNLNIWVWFHSLLLYLKCRNPAETLHEMWNFTLLSLIPLSVTLSEMLRHLSWNVELYTSEFDPTLFHFLWNVMTQWSPKIRKIHMLKYTCKTLQYCWYVLGRWKTCMTRQSNSDLSLTVRIFLPPELAGRIPESVAVIRNLLQKYKNLMNQKDIELETSSAWGLIESYTTLRRDEGIPSECPRFAIHNEACQVMDVANLGHEDGIPKSLPQCGDWLFFSFLPKNSH